jgi:tRNA dimethylallyltransferase
VTGPNPAATDQGPWPEVLVVVGPTASGKSALALELADLIGGEIVNADAYQVYRGMDIGTAKPAAGDRARVPHHLVDILDVTDELSVAQYQRLSRDVLHELSSRGVPAVVVGGSGLYVRALLDDLRFPGSDPQIRARWESELGRLGPEGLHAVLAERDPQAAAHILPSNGRRIVRALEVGEMTGEGFPARLPVDGPALVPHQSFGLDIPRQVLDERIARRVAGMFDAGLVDEVRSLVAGGLREGPTASRALGYPQVMDLIDGVVDEDTARERIVAATRAYARRQQRWFRRDPRTVWLPVVEGPASTASAIAARWSALPRTLGP